LDSIADQFKEMLARRNKLNHKHEEGHRPAHVEMHSGHQQHQHQEVARRLVQSGHKHEHQEAHHHHHVVAAVHASRAKEAQGSHKQQQHKEAQHHHVVAAAHAAHAARAKEAQGSHQQQQHKEAATSFRTEIMGRADFEVQAQKLAKLVGCAKRHGAAAGACSKMVDEALFCLAFAENFKEFAHQEGAEKQRKECARINEKMQLTHKVGGSTPATHAAAVAHKNATERAAAPVSKQQQQQPAHLSSKAPPPAASSSKAVVAEPTQLHDMSSRLLARVDRQALRLSKLVGCRRMKRRASCDQYMHEAAFCLVFVRDNFRIGTAEEQQKCSKLQWISPKALSFLQRAAARHRRGGPSAATKPEDDLAQEMTHDLEMNFNKIAPFGKEDTAKELQDHAAKTQDTLVDAVENAEVAEIKRAVFRALTRLRAATIKEFDTIARLETQAIDAYNDAHHYRAENPLAHLHEDEAPVETDKLKSFH